MCILIIVNVLGVKKKQIVLGWAKSKQFVVDDKLRNVTKLTLKAMDVFQKRAPRAYRQHQHHCALTLLSVG